MVEIFVVRTHQKDIWTVVYRISIFFILRLHFFLENFEFFHHLCQLYIVLSTSCHSDHVLVEVCYVIFHFFGIISLRINWYKNKFQLYVSSLWNVPDDSVNCVHIVKSTWTEMWAVCVSKVEKIVWTRKISTREWFSWWVNESPISSNIWFILF